METRAVIVKNGEVLVALSLEELQALRLSKTIMGMMQWESVEDIPTDGEIIRIEMPDKHFMKAEAFKAAVEFCVWFTGTKYAAMREDAKRFTQWASHDRELHPWIRGYQRRHFLQAPVPFIPSADECAAAQASAAETAAVAEAERAAAIVKRIERTAAEAAQAAAEAERAAAEAERIAAEAERGEKSAVDAALAAAVAKRTANEAEKAKQVADAAAATSSGENAAATSSGENAAAASSGETPEENETPEEKAARVAKSINVQITDLWKDVYELADFLSIYHLMQLCARTAAVAASLHSPEEMEAILRMPLDGVYAEQKRIHDRFEAQKAEGTLLRAQGDKLNPNLRDYPRIIGHYNSLSKDDSGEGVTTSSLSESRDESFNHFLDDPDRFDDVYEVYVEPDEGEREMAAPYDPTQGERTQLVGSEGDD